MRWWPTGSRARGNEKCEKSKLSFIPKSDGRWKRCDRVVDSILEFFQGFDDFLPQRGVVEKHIAHGRIVPGQLLPAGLRWHEPKRTRHGCVVGRPSGREEYLLVRHNALSEIVPTQCLLSAIMVGQRREIGVMPGIPLRGSVSTPRRFHFLIKIV